MCSPVGFAGVLPDDQYDPYKIRVSDKVNKPPSKEKVDELINERVNKVNAFGTLPSLPAGERPGKFLRMAKAEFENFPEQV